MLLVIFYEDIQSQIFYLQLQLSNYKEGWAVSCLLPYYGPKVLGRKVMTDSIATHPEPVCAQTKIPLLKLWSHTHGRWNWYRRIMAKKYNITTIKKIYLRLDKISKGFSVKIMKRTAQHQETHYKWNGKSQKEITLVLSQ